MKIRLNSVIVRDQAAALQFYTGTLGFELRVDLPAGEYRWLTVGSPEEPDGAQLLLEPDAHPAAARYQRALYEDGIPATTFEVKDILEVYKRLSDKGVKFKAPPANAGGPMIAVFDDTCGNMIQVYQLP